MKMAEQLGIELQEMLFIEQLVTLFQNESLPDLVSKMRNHLREAHTGHQIYLGVCYGSTIATRLMQSKIKSNQLLCRKN
jgi:hypothetical protein